MNLNSALLIFEVIICVLLIVSILLQQKEGGLGTVFGGSSGGESYRSKRGMDSLLFRATVILGILFAANSLAIALV